MDYGLGIYDIKNDIGERNNVIDQHGDIAGRLENWLKKHAWNRGTA